MSEKFFDSLCRALDYLIATEKRAVMVVAEVLTLEEEGKTLYQVFIEFDFGGSKFGEARKVLADLWFDDFSAVKLLLDHLMANYPLKDTKDFVVAPTITRRDYRFKLRDFPAIFED